jgi:hypothetical protein
MRKAFLSVPMLLVLLIAMGCATTTQPAKPMIGRNPSLQDAFVIVAKTGLLHRDKNRPLLVGQIDRGQPRMREVAIPLELQNCDFVVSAGSKLVAGIDNNEILTTLDLQTGEVGRSAIPTDGSGVPWDSLKRGGKTLSWKHDIDDSGTRWILSVRNADGSTRRVWECAYIDPSFEEPMQSVPVIWLDDRHVLSIRVDGDPSNLLATGINNIVVVDITGGAKDIGSVPWGRRLDLVGPRGSDGDALIISDAGSGDAKVKSLTRAYSVNV